MIAWEEPFREALTTLTTLIRDIKAGKADHLL